MARVPDADTHRRDFAALPFAQRRQVVSAVNRGREVADPKLAGHAVLVARRQARLWRWAWLLGPAVGAFRLIDSLQAALVSSALSTGVLGLMSWWWFTRARRAEALNFALTTEGKRAARKKQGKAGKQGTSGKQGTASTAAGAKKRGGGAKGSGGKGSHLPRSNG